MDSFNQYGDVIEPILQEYANIPYRYGDVNTFVVVSRDYNHFLLMDEGWQDGLRMYGVPVKQYRRNGLHGSLRDSTSSSCPNIALR
ncbi:MAG: element excision factor XisI family protein [Spirulinaceae cyanobacterium]